MFSETWNSVRGYESELCENPILKFLPNLTYVKSDLLLSDSFKKCISVIGHAEPA